MDNNLYLWPDTSTKMTSKLLLGMFLCRLPKQMRAQLANYNATSPGDLSAAADAIWAQYGGKFTAAEVTVAAATADGQRGRSPSPRHVNNKGGNRGRSLQCQDGGKGGTSSRNQTPGRRQRHHGASSTTSLEPRPSTAISPAPTQTR